MNTYDIIVIGGGPGGYVAAIRASKEGKKVALVEQGHLGGTCLNRGCIPSKALLKHAEIIHAIRDASKYGVEVGEMTLSLPKMMQRKNQVINQLRGGIAHLLRTGKIDVYQGKGEIQPDKTVVITGDKPESIKARSIIIATGSSPTVPPIEGLDQVLYHTSDTIFDIEEIPASLAIVGGGVIGVEFASIFESLGTKVTIIEMADRILATEDEMASQLLTKHLRKIGVTIITKAKVTAVKAHDSQKQLIIYNEAGAKQDVVADQILVAIGRRPNLSASANLSLDTEGPFIKVNTRMETSVPDIYAVGDVIGNWQLAHIASAEGIVAAMNATGQARDMDYRIVPRCMYTYPEIASVGLSEREAIEKGFQVKTSVYQLAVNGKALASDHTEGFVKLIADEAYGEILGAVMVGPHVTEMISQISAYMQLEGTVEEMANLIFPHPTVSETLLEAASDWLDKGIHS
ncbi:dihydrolipoyl dehydrogenase [Brevibacillus laterosporus]|uniref:dihydrolipoyl dehydrogenase n=1 Tax=Brevibacillus laterosporus TaxID=1465 RepID=UPI000CE56E7C|nr:dihydrolipoyl dehydrogenase [Brevibacillus laterosporus]MED1666316.1 dihydrolipoyl dehydrogenase [Brevibacillus laterosporus]MED1670639.1 dihydrolipoyl dehydrogenase [Brevibacillus laterosporus]MED1716654.1 dihydrolipoyl dehydrogenase [Brevibacillus laterosporus]PPA89445.1 dihydrolipoyl dehydrogenase [Brevibacillus laterosporus]